MTHLSSRPATTPAGPTTLDRIPLRIPVMLTAADLEPALVRRLAALGLRRGAVLRTIGRTVGGGRVVDVAGSRIALDRSVMRHLTVAAA